MFDLDRLESRSFPWPLASEDEKFQAGKQLGNAASTGTKTALILQRSAAKMYLLADGLNPEGYRQNRSPTLE